VKPPVEAAIEFVRLLNEDCRVLGERMRAIYFVSPPGRLREPRPLR
jgi:hypothetical protein